MFFPADIPIHARPEFRKNYLAITKGTDRLFLFAADHKIEHLDTDFYGASIDPAAHNPKHLFSIAHHPWIGAFATQLGLVARYGNEYSGINYIIKLNSKTNIVPLDLQDPFSKELWTVDDAISFKQSSGLSLRGIGLTLYLGSLYEASMLAQAAQSITQAHKHGLITLLWVYPRGKAVSAPHEVSLLAGAAGVAAALGADFVKLHPPTLVKKEELAFSLHHITQAAGNTKVIYAGGPAATPDTVVNTLSLQLSSGSSGAALGRNIYQHSLPDALKLSKTIAELIYGTELITPRSEKKEAP